MSPCTSVFSLQYQKEPIRSVLDREFLDRCIGYRIRIGIDEGAVYQHADELQLFRALNAEITFTRVSVSAFKNTLNLTMICNLMKSKFFIQPYKTPDSRLEMQRQPELKQRYACTQRSPWFPSWRGHLVFNRSPILRHEENSEKNFCISSSWSISFSLAVLFSFRSSAEIEES